MLDQFSIFTKSGLLLWSKTWCRGRDDLLRDFIEEVLIEKRVGGTSTEIGNYAFEWSFLNDLNLVFVAVYQRMVPLAYVGELVAQIKESFLTRYRKQLSSLASSNQLADYAAYQEFDGTFDEVYMQLQKDEIVSKGRGSGEEEKREEGGLSRQGSSEAPLGNPLLNPLLSPSASLSSPSQSGEEEGSPRKQSRPGKVGRQSSTIKQHASRKDLEALDYSKRSSQDEKEGEVGEDGSNQDEKDEEEEEEEESALTWRQQEEEEEEEGDEKGELDGTSSSSVTPSGWFSSLFSASSSSSLSSDGAHSTIDEELLDPILETIRTKLNEKNVGLEVCEAISDSVKGSLLGTSLSSSSSSSSSLAWLWQGSNSAEAEARAHVEASIREAIFSVLHPEDSSSNVMRMIQQYRTSSSSTRDRERPFVITFVGVNGVGKSTSLSKVAHFLQNHGLEVLIVACDTFRSGAIEQLQVHARRLGVEVFSSRYGASPSQTAREGIEEGARRGVDVVLVDTAGRMQNNKKLMEDLRTLVGTNQPNLILYVVEALVGHDGIDQIKFFTKALSSATASLRDRQQVMHQGIVLTKFDTVDDKVGAALSVSYVSRLPIVFLGTGQKYSHLAKMNTKLVLNSLFK